MKYKLIYGVLFGIFYEALLKAKNQIPGVLVAKAFNDAFQMVFGNIKQSSIQEKHNEKILL